MKLLVSLLSVIAGFFTAGCERDVSQLGDPVDSATVVSIQPVLLLPRLGNPSYKIAPEGYDPNTTRKVGPRKTISKKTATEGWQIQVERGNGQRIEILQPNSEQFSIENGDTVKLYKHGLEFRAYK